MRNIKPKINHFVARMTGRHRMRGDGVFG